MRKLSAPSGRWVFGHRPTLVLLVAIACVAAKTAAIADSAVLQGGGSRAQSRFEYSATLVEGPGTEGPAPSSNETPTDWNQMQADWSRLGAEAASGPIDLRRAAAIDSLRFALEGIVMSSLAVKPAATLPEPARTWVFALVREGLISGDSRARNLVLSHWDPSAVLEEDPDGRLTLPAALTLASEGAWQECLDWLETGVLALDEIPYGSVLRTEALLALQDTLAAGSLAGRLLADEPGLPVWARITLEKARILHLIADGDSVSARAALAAFSGRRDERGFWLVQQARLAEMRGQTSAADSISWIVVKEFPGGRTAGQRLRDHVDPGSGQQAGLGRDRIRTLLDAAEHRVDLDRFTRLARSLSDGVSDASGDTLALREARLAYRARSYEQVVERSWRRPWTPNRYPGAEWGIIQGRAYRNTARPDSMAAWFGRALAAGLPHQRIAVAWEWAREADYLRRFAEADSLYGVYLEAGGTDRRAEALIGQGLCRLSLGRPDLAIHGFKALAAHDDPEDAAAGWFWIYRSELVRNDREAAVRALRSAAGGGQQGGYYAWRARSAIWAAENGGPGIDDPSGYWSFLNRLGGMPTLEEARALQRTSVSAEGLNAWKRGRDLLLLFRHTGRTAWARLVQDDLAAIAGRAEPQERVIAYLTLGLPDLAARSAVRSGPRRQEWTHPTPYAAAVASASATWGIAPEWIWSVMRRESFFESSAVSSAGATGLMQLMQATAKETAALHKLEEGPLYSPRINLHLGVAHLADLREKEPDDWPVALAAYNAGLVNARRWRHPDDDHDFYVERIGFAETRTYVRRVLEGFWVYRRILRNAP